MKEFENFDEYQLAEHKSLLNMCDKSVMYALEDIKQEIYKNDFLTAQECVELISNIIDCLEQQIKDREQE